MCPTTDRSTHLGVGEAVGEGVGEGVGAGVGLHVNHANRHALMEAEVAIARIRSVAREATRQPIDPRTSASATAWERAWARESEPATG